MHEQELIPAAVDDPNNVEPSVQNGDAVSVLLPNLSILGVGESNHLSHVGTLPSASCLDVTANPKASSCESSSLSCSSAQGKSLIFDVRSVVSIQIDGMFVRIYPPIAVPVLLFYGLSHYS